jgi:hypothetical protein
VLSQYVPQGEKVAFVEIDGREARCTPAHESLKANPSVVGGRQRAEKMCDPLVSCRQPSDDKGAFVVVDEIYAPLP